MKADGMREHTPSRYGVLNRILAIPHLTRARPGYQPPSVPRRRTPPTPPIRAHASVLVASTNFSLPHPPSFSLSCAQVPPIPPNGSTDDCPKSDSRRKTKRRTSGGERQLRLGRGTSGTTGEWRALVAAHLLTNNASRLSIPALALLALT